MKTPTKDAARVAHDYWPCATDEQRIIRSRVCMLVEKRDAEWTEIVGLLHDELLDATKRIAACSLLGRHLGRHRG